MRIDNEKKVFYRNVFALVIPMALQNLINVGVTSADVIMLGRVGETALSASSLGGQVYFILNLIIFGLTSGAAVITAQYWGKGDVRTIEKVLGIALRVALFVSILFTLAAWIIPRPLMRLFTNEEEVIAQGISYLRVIAFSYVLACLTMTYLNIMRSHGGVQCLPSGKCGAERGVYLRNVRCPGHGRGRSRAGNGLRESRGVLYCRILRQEEERYSALQNEGPVRKG